MWKISGTRPLSSPRLWCLHSTSWFSLVGSGRPHLIAKAAQSLDGGAWSLNGIGSLYLMGRDISLESDSNRKSTFIVSCSLDLGAVIAVDLS